jgi:hypothetical protein
MKYTYLILIIIMIILIFILTSKSVEIKTNKTNKTNMNMNMNNNLIILDAKKQLSTDKPYLWFYWEDTNKKRPGYIDICIDSIYKQCGNTFNIIQLNNNNIDEYLPEIKYNHMDFSKLRIAHKVDFYRILLMYKYGGIYIDVDILILKDLTPIYDKLKEYDYVGFGCTGNFCKIGMGQPSNWIICSRPNTKLMKNILNRYYDKLKNLNKVNGDTNTNTNIGYHDLGKILIWEELDNLIKNENYQYYHYPNLYDGTRDVNGNWVSMDRLFSEENIIYDKPNELMFIVLYNSDATDEMKKISKEDLLKSSYFISKYFRQEYQ